MPQALGARLQAEKSRRKEVAREALLAEEAARAALLAEQRHRMQLESSARLQARHAAMCSP